MRQTREQMAGNPISVRLSFSISEASEPRSGVFGIRVAQFWEDGPPATQDKGQAECAAVFRTGVQWNGNAPIPWTMLL